MTGNTNIWLNGVMGVVVGDALGCPVQFESRREVAGHPVTGMRGYGTFNLPEGSWTDDSSLTIALLESIGRLSRIDLDDIMEKVVERLAASSRVQMTAARVSQGTMTSNEFDYWFSEEVRRGLGMVLGVVRAKAVAKAQAAGAGSASSAVLRRTYRKEYAVALHIAGNRKRISSKHRVVAASTGGASGRRRTRSVSKRTQDIREYYGPDRSFILRFFEGDIPMALSSADTASGTAKRESQSEAFTANPFSYALYPLTLTDKGPCLLDKPSVQFAVNKESENLDMANEFMRFLVSPQELGSIASAKRLPPVTSDLAFDGVYAPFSTIDPSRIIATHEVGLADDVTIQYRVAAYQVANGEATVDEAIAGYGSYEL